MIIVIIIVIVTAFTWRLHPFPVIVRLSLINSDILTLSVLLYGDNRYFYYKQSPIVQCVSGFSELTLYSRFYYHWYPRMRLRLMKRHLRCNTSIPDVWFCYTYITCRSILAEWNFEGCHTSKKNRETKK